MSGGTLSLRHLSFTGPEKITASIQFELGLNVIYGSSDSGKSFILEAIDFMLGAGSELRDIPERVGYESVFLGLVHSDGTSFTLERSTAGGAYRCYEGVHIEAPNDAEYVKLGAKHNPTKEDNLSVFLLTKLGLQNKKIRKNKAGDTNSLSFRNLARLCLVSENEIQKQGSPVLSGQHTTGTAEYSTFKLLLTGVDDSSIENVDQNSGKRASQAGKIEIINELLAEQQDRLNSLVGEEDDKSELEAQLENLRKTIEKEKNVVKQTENEYQKQLDLRIRLRSDLGVAKERRAEIAELQSRFALLDEHYGSDLERLEGIREAGALATALDGVNCPLCGAKPDVQHVNSDCDGNIDAVVKAVDAESEKIVRLREELRETISQLSSETEEFKATVPTIESSLLQVNALMEDISPSLNEHRQKYSDIIEKQYSVKSAVDCLRSIEDLTARRQSFESATVLEQTESVPSTDLSQSVLYKFSSLYEKTLKNWNFPGIDRTHFDSETRDFVISGKPRSSSGKGLRAISYAAFTYSILEFTRTQKLHHPGFIVLDTPLLAYREPDGDGDDLSGTDVHEKFYENLSKILDRQVVILENIGPIDELAKSDKVIFFGKNPAVGRYGFFPYQE